MNRYLVRYPSGTRLRLHGKLGRADVPDEHGFVPCINTGREVLLLDPRAIIKNRATKELAYHPSMVAAEEHAPWVRDWLSEHLAWAAQR